MLYYCVDPLARFLVKHCGVRGARRGGRRMIRAVHRMSMATFRMSDGTMRATTQPLHRRPAAGQPARVYHSLASNTAQSASAGTEAARRPWYTKCLGERSLSARCICYSIHCPRWLAILISTAFAISVIVGIIATVVHEISGVIDHIKNDGPGGKYERGWSNFEEVCRHSVPILEPHAHKDKRTR